MQNPSSGSWARHGNQSAMSDHFPQDRRTARNLLYTVRGRSSPAGVFWRTIIASWRLHLLHKIVLDWWKCGPWLSIWDHLSSITSHKDSLNDFQTPLNWERRGHWLALLWQLETTHENFQSSKSQILLPLQNLACISPIWVYRGREVQCRDSGPRSALETLQTVTRENTLLFETAWTHKSIENTISTGFAGFHPLGVEQATIIHIPKYDCQVLCLDLIFSNTKQSYQKSFAENYQTSLERSNL